MSGILKRLFSKKTNENKSKPAKPSEDPNSVEPIILTRDRHCVSRKDISKNALKVLYRLNEAGYQAYLVGGGVRDILLGLNPKDFDIATDATPEQVHDLFRNCRLIGRRFRLAHILFGREVIEVATFRASHEGSEQKTAVIPPRHDRKNRNNKPKRDHLAQTSTQGMLVRDNVYGTMQEDAFRRDFTVNALYYTVKDFSVIDYADGLQDLAERQLRLIGEPTARYREDPVRILRAIRLSCKLNLTIEEKTAEPIKELANLLSHVSSARLWDECNKLLLAGHAKNTWQALCDREVAEYLFSQTVTSLSNKEDDKKTAGFDAFIQAALSNTDKRIANEQPVTPAFLFAVFLWKPLQDLTENLMKKGMPAYEANQKAAAKVMDIQRHAIAIPKRFSVIAKEMWSLQFRLTNLKRKSVHSLINHPRFRAAYDFLCLRAGNDRELVALAKWWTDYQEAEQGVRIKMLNQATKFSSKKRKKPRKKYGKHSNQATKKSNNLPEN